MAPILPPWFRTYDALYEGDNPELAGVTIPVHVDLRAAIMIEEEPGGVRIHTGPLSVLVTASIRRVLRDLTAVTCPVFQIASFRRASFPAICLQ